MSSVKNECGAVFLRLKDAGCQSLSVTELEQVSFGKRLTGVYFHCRFKLAAFAFCWKKGGGENKTGSERLQENDLSMDPS